MSENKQSFEQWLCLLSELLIERAGINSDKIDDLLNSQWIDAIYDMWKEDRSPEEALEIVIFEEQPWNNILHHKCNTQ